MENINKNKLVEEIKRLSALIREHKNNIRRPHITGWEGGRPVWAEPREIDGRKCGVCRSQSELVSLKEYVTLLCSLRAHLRGKVHMSGMTFDEQKEFLENNKKRWSSFIEEVEAAA